MRKGSALLLVICALVFAACDTRPQAPEFVETSTTTTTLPGGQAPTTTVTLPPLGGLRLRWEGPDTDVETDD